MKSNKTTLVLKKIESQGDFFLAPTILQLGDLGSGAIFSSIWDASSNTSALLIRKFFFHSVSGKTPSSILRHHTPLLFWAQ